MQKKFYIKKHLFYYLDEIIHLIVDINGNVHVFWGENTWIIDLKEAINEEIVETFSIELVASDVILATKSSKQDDINNKIFGYISSW